MRESVVRALLKRATIWLSSMRAVGLLPLRAVGMRLIALALFGAILAWNDPPPTEAATNTAFSVTITPKDQFPPGAITDLDAAPSSTEEGSALLLWTAPHENNQQLPAASPVQNYQVRYATFSVPDLGGNTTTWFNNAADLTGEPSPPLAAGEQETMMVTGLEPGATIYFGAKSSDNAGISLIDSNAQNGPQAQALVLDLPPPVVTGLNIIESTDSLTLQWSASTATDAANYRIYWDTSAPADSFASTVTLPLGASYYTFSNLTIQNTYFFYITALDRGLPSYLGNALEGSPSAVASGIPGNTPPLAASGLTAISVSTGTIVWEWTDNSNNENGFRIYSTTGGLVGIVGFGSGTGGTVQFTETNLTPNGNYGRVIRAFNGVGESPDSNAVSRYSLARPPTGTALSNVWFTSMTVNWSADGNAAGTVFHLEYATDSGFAGSSTATLTATSLNLSSLFSNATYYFRVRARNGENVFSAFDATASTRTPSVGIRSLTASGGDQNVALDWLDNTDFNHAGYYIYRTDDLGQPFVRLNATPHTTSYYLDQPLVNGTTYFYRLTSVDSIGQEGVTSSTVSARAAKPPTARPQEPTGVLGSLDSSGQFTVRWTPVTMDVNRSTRVELAGYRIYKSSAVEGPYALRDFVASGSNLWLSPDLVPPIVWYLVRAVDTSDNESDNSMRIETIAQQSLVAAAQDETLHIAFPQVEAVAFSSTTNNRNEDVRVVITRNPAEENGTTLTSYQVKAVGSVTGKDMSDIQFKKPVINLQFRYQTGGNGAPYLPKAAKLPSLAAFTHAYGAKDVGIFFSGGIEFVKYGGVVDENRGTVSVKTAKPFGTYQVRQVLRATEFTLSGLTPRKIFTPNGDGVNDDITLLLENPKDSMVSQAKIFDVTGAEVADFQIGVVAGQLGVTSLKWDGRTRTGEIARSGVYIYQVQAEGKVINGTIVVAR